MCGIAGIFRTDGDLVDEASRRAVDAAIASLNHRGPDARNAVTLECAYFAHARLSILDIAGGGQPFLTFDEAHCIAYNGELYDFDALRGALMKRFPLRSRSDTEVLLYALRDRGVEALRDINGMYAFAFYDRRLKRLTLAVDRCGIKPMYYAIRTHFVAFASELRAMRVLLARLGEREHVDIEALRYYLRDGWVPAPLTLMLGVSKLLPGEALTMSLHHVMERYRTALPEPCVVAPKAQDDPDIRVKNIEARLESIVDSQLIADVPIGLFLSGGIDSSLLLALASRRHRGIQTFSIGFSALGDDTASFDESVYASRVAQHFGSQHHELQLRPQDVFDAVTDIVDAVDEPIADPATIPLYFLARFAARSVKVCLTGDGGDELFGGYQHHRLRDAKARFNSAPSFVKRIVVGSVRCLGGLKRLGVPMSSRLVAAGDLLIDPAICHGPFSNLSSTLLPQQLQAAAAASASWHDPDALLQEEIFGPLSGYMLPKTDRVTMRWSVESRVPFLDDRLIAAARTLPWCDKVRGSSTKSVLRKILASDLPREIVQRRKMGFRVPLDRWLRGELSNWVKRTLDDSSPLTDLIGANQLRFIVEMHTSGRRNLGPQLWSLAVLSRWLATGVSEPATQ